MFPSSSPPPGRRTEEVLVVGSMRLIALTGIDGSGKSTQARRLVERLRAQGQGVAACAVWDLLQGPASPGSSPLGGVGSIREYLAGLGSVARCLFVFHALHETMERARRQDLEILVLVGYWYKYAAVEAGLGTPTALLEELAGLFPEPEQTLWLDLPPEQAALRKQEFTRYECGGRSPSSESFQAFQAECRSRLEVMAGAGGWCRVDATRSEDEILGDLESILAAGAFRGEQGGRS